MYAPNIHTLKLYTRAAEVVRGAAKLKGLRNLALTFDWPEAVMDRAVLIAARDVLRDSPAAGVKKLVIRRLAADVEGVLRDGSQDNRLYKTVCETVKK